MLESIPRIFKRSRTDPLVMDRDHAFFRRWLLCVPVDGAEVSGQERTALRPMRPAGTAALLRVYSQSKSKGRSDEL